MLLRRWALSWLGGTISDADLCRRVAELPASELSRLVLHRGLHHPDDGLDRPLENTVSAYERAWAMARAHNCECDVTLTRDGVVVLSHDDTLKRLALRPESELAQRAVSSQNSAEVFSVPLKDGSRVASLEQVLEAAKRIGPWAHLVIEIKGKDVKCAERLASMLNERLDLAHHVSVVMGFDLETVHAFAACARKFNAPVMLLTQLAKAREKRSDPCLNLKDPEPLLALLKRPGSTLDGIYCQFDPEFLSSQADGRFTALCARTKVGVWGYAFLDPDSISSARQLMQQGVLFCNTDLPSNFMDG